MNLRMLSLLFLSSFGCFALQADSDYEKTLFLTPGGMYTEEDIAANGNMTRSQKFQDFIPSHKADPEIGEFMCPISLKKANAECTWIIGGNAYQFCCPFCIDEFLSLAKEHPEEIKAPEAYLK